MFSSGSNIRVEYVVEGYYADGTKVALDLASFFPMPPALIFRGSGLGITYGTLAPFFNTAPDKIMTLCRFLSRRTEGVVAGNGHNFVSIQLNFRYDPLRPNNLPPQPPLTEKWFTSCGPSDVFQLNTG